MLPKRTDPSERDMSDPAEIIEQMTGIIDVKDDADAHLHELMTGLIRDHGWTKDKLDALLRSAIFFSRFGPKASGMRKSPRRQ